MGAVGGGIACVAGSVSVSRVKKRKLRGGFRAEVLRRFVHGGKQWCAGVPEHIVGWRFVFCFAVGGVKPSDVFICARPVGL